MRLTESHHDNKIPCFLSQGFFHVGVAIPPSRTCIMTPDLLKLTLEDKACLNYSKHFKYHKLCGSFDRQIIFFLY